MAALTPLKLGLPRTIDALSLDLGLQPGIADRQMLLRAERALDVRFLRVGGARNQAGEEEGKAHRQNRCTDIGQK